MSEGAEKILEVKNLSSHFLMPGRKTIEAVDGVSFDVHRGETVALVGESGSGKSVTAFSVMQLLERNTRHPHGEILFKGQDILKMDFRELRKLRGNEISIIFQEPGTSLNPVYTVGSQVAEALLIHQGLTSFEAKERVIEMFHEVGIPRAEQTVDSYPHELSGGMKQRVMIAMAIACKPDLLIADEPTTALDVTIQAQILRLIKKVQREHNIGVLFITHDLGVVNEIADRILVMNGGKMVERGERREIFKNPKEAYTQHLLGAIPKPSEARTGLRDECLLELKDLKTWFPIRQGVLQRTVSHVKAVDGVSLKVFKGETLALVGESGSGKTTIGKTIARLIPSYSGSVLFKGQNLLEMSPREFHPLRKNIQVIFQDPASSLDPRMLVLDVVAEGLRNYKLAASEREVKEQVQALLERVGLSADMMYRFPHEFSGGQRQRICIARALAVKPEFIICDEATSALDVSVQATVLELLQDLQKEFGLTYLFITHNLAVVRHLADRVVVMKNGQLVEEGATQDLFDAPQHAYTKELLSSAPSMDPDQQALSIG